MIEKLFREHAGYLHSKDLQRNRQLYYHLQKMVESGVVLKLRRGLYKHSEYAELNHWQEVSLMYPKAVFCMHSACAFYELTTYMPHTNHLAIENKQKLTLAEYPPVKLYYWSDKIFNQHKTNQDGVMIYSLERSVCDAIKYDNQIGQDLVKEVVEAYLQRRDKDIELLLRTAKEVNIYNKVHQVFSLLI